MSETLLILTMKLDVSDEWQHKTGAVIVEEDHEMEGLPDWYHSMEELIIFISHMSFTRISREIDDSWDFVWNYQKFEGTQPTGSLDNFFVNGEYQPTICMTAGKWIRLRFLTAEPSEECGTYYIGNGECTQYLLARDGVIVQDSPREVGHAVWLAPGSRADVAISCPGDPSEGTKTYPIWTVTDSEDQMIAFIEVTGTSTQPVADLTTFTPIRPGYLQSLMPGENDDDLEHQLYPYQANSRSDIEYIPYWPNVKLTGSLS